MALAIDIMEKTPKAKNVRWYILIASMRPRNSTNSETQIVCHDLTCVEEVCNPTPQGQCYNWWTTLMKRMK